jgi:putative DNA primase/helicase
VADLLSVQRRDGTIDGETEFYVLPEVFKSEMCAGYNSTDIARAMIDRGHLEPGEGGRASIAKRLPALGLRKVYHILPTIFDEGA